MADKVMMIALTPTMDKGKIAKWTKKIGDKIAQGDVICEVETDKSSMEYESLNDGILLHILVEEGQSAEIGQTIAIVGEKGEDVSKIVELESSSTKSEDSSKGEAKEEAEKERSESVQPEKASTSSSARIKASPLAKKIALEKGIDLQKVNGSGPQGRILVKDVNDYKPTSGGGSVASALEDKEIKVEGVRAIIAQRLSESKFSAPHFYLKASIRMEQLVGLRNTLNAQLQKQGLPKVSMNAFFIKLAAEAIKKNPVVNSSWQEKKIVQYGSIDIGLAVDLGNGLLTPIVRNCGNKGIVQIDDELQTLIEKVRDGSISSAEYTGATFTISNLGSFGVEEFTAIINPPGAAILAIGASKQVPVVSNNGSLEVGTQMKVSLSCDHRVIDGSAAAKFLQMLQQIFENSAVALF